MDEVAGDAVIYNGTTWTVDQTVLVPYCSVAGCAASNGMGTIPAVITRFGSTREELLKSGEATVYLRMDCCKNEAKQLIKRLMPY